MAAHERTDDETTPLLAGGRSTSYEEPRKHQRRLFIMVLMCVLLVVIDAGGSIEIPALTAVLKNDVCARYNVKADADHQVDCDAHAVMKEVAMLSNIEDTLEVIPTIALALQFGVLADRIGRKPILLLAMAGLALRETYIRMVLWWWDVFPTRLIWLAPILEVIGGGSLTGSSIIFTIVADVYEQDSRANMFYILFSSILVASLIGNTVGAELTSQNHQWAAFMLSYGMLIGGTCLIFFLPETLQTKPGFPASHEQRETVDDEHVERIFNFRLKRLAKGAAESTRFIWTSRNISLLLFMFFVGALARQSLVVLILYATEKWNISVGQSSFLASAMLAAALAAFIVLPLITKVMVGHYKMPLQRKDLVLSQAQTFLLVAGMFTIAFAPSLWVLVAATVVVGLGTGVVATVRSLINSLVHQHHLATLNAAIAVVFGMGQIVAGPVQAAAFSKGLDLGGVWLGLPFVVAGGLFFLTLIAIFCIRLPKPDDVTQDINEN